MLSLEGDDYELMLLSCSDPTPTPYRLSAAGPAGQPTTHWASLPPGSYTMFPGSLPSSVTLQSNFSGPLVGSACASAGAVTLDPTGST